MKIKLSNDAIINDANVYLNGQYQEELVIQVHNLGYIEALKVLQDTEALEEIYVYNDSDSLISHYLDFVDLQSIYTADSVTTIVLSQKSKLNTQFESLKKDIVEMGSTIEEIDSQINPVFDWENSTLEECKEHKRTEIAEICTQTIYAGFDTETTEGTQHFGLTLEDQANLNGLVPQISIGAPSVLYHADGELCRIYTAEEFLSIMTAATTHKTYNTTLCNHINKWIDSCEIKEDISKITFNYFDMPIELQEHMTTLLSPDQDSNIVDPELPPETVFPIE